MSLDDSVYKGKISIKGYESLCKTFNDYRSSLKDYPDQDLFDSRIHEFDFHAYNGKRIGYIKISMDTSTKDMLDLFNKLVDICMTYSAY